MASQPGEYADGSREHVNTNRLASKKEVISLYILYLLVLTIILIRVLGDSSLIETTDLLYLGIYLVAFLTWRGHSTSLIYISPSDSDEIVRKLRKHGFRKIFKSPSRTWYLFAKWPGIFYGAAFRQEDTRLDVHVSDEAGNGV